MLDSMPTVKWLLSGSLDPQGVFDCVRFDLAFRRAHPDFFPFDGIYLFCGPQGSGKTLSAVSAAYRLAQRFPKLLICTNLILSGFPDPERIVPYLGDASLDNVSNGEYGVLYLIDEVHTLYNSLNSKGIDPSVMSQICQQRKQRKIIMGTSQVFNRVAKPFREQCKVIVLCRNYFKYVQVNSVVRGDKCVDSASGQIDAPVDYHRVWIHRPELYALYDTYAVIDNVSRGTIRKGVKYV